MFDIRSLKRIFIKSTGLTLAALFVNNNIMTFRWVNVDNMSPVLFTSASSRDLALILRATKYHKNDIVMYLNPESGNETFGRLVVTNCTEGISQMNGIPPGHCWIENDNVRSDENDSNTFGAIPLGLIRGYVLATVYPPSRAKFTHA